ncbi:hypothetical protein HPP92_025407 [Vanilla planifolia]|uniref:Uncharacterized protein n=1 Tax=Vanilla planifolia TaxID=51239 RepID=A0A835PHH7_VANPL|nr:hypothetical protein HPP92_025407 [Vanilla planifolia]
METNYLDFVLVPLGLAVMIGYHLWLLDRVRRRPKQTVIGINAVNRRMWVRSMMEDPIKNGVLAVQTLRNNIMASTLMASTAIMLCSLITVLMTGGGGGCGGGDAAQTRAVGGEHEPHGSLPQVLGHPALLPRGVPPQRAIREVLQPRQHTHQRAAEVPVAAADVAGVRGWGGELGSYCWSLGLGACYFSLPLFLWVFGPIPMLGCCLVLVVMLYFLDIYSDWGEGDDAGGEEAEMEWVVGEHS